MRIRGSRVVILILIGWISVFGKNLIENSSFEVGRWGFDAMPQVFIRNWSKYIYPEITNQTAAHGKYSLKLSNPTGMDGVGIIFAPIEFRKKTFITISFYGKGEPSGVKISVGLKCGWKLTLSKSFRLTDKWQRYSFSGFVAEDLFEDSKRGGARGVYALWMAVSSLSDPVFKHVWIDGVQVEEGKLTEFRPKRELEVAINMKKFSKKRHLVYEVGEKEDAEVWVYTVKGNKSYRGEYFIRDIVSEEAVSHGEIRGKTDSTGHGISIIHLPPMKRRAYLLEVDIISGTHRARGLRAYGAIKDLSRRCRGPVFFGGSIETMDRHYRRVSMPPDYRMRANKIDPEIYVKLAAKIGWQWVHMYHQASIDVVGIQRGRYSWKDTDFFVDMLIKNELEPVALLTAAGSSRQIPRWAWSNKRTEGGTSKRPGFLMDEKIYEDYCYRAARRYRGKIVWWESWNEPGVKMRSYEYLPLLKACWKGIKRGNPDAKVLGLCGTWDIGGDMYGWVKRCLKLGAAKYMDAISIHGYHVKSRDYGRQVQSIARELTGRIFDVWDTESGIIIVNPYGFKYYFNYNKRHIYTSRESANLLTQHIVSELASGVKRQSWFNLDTTYARLGKPGMSLLHFDGAPSAALIADNVVIDFLMGAKLYKEVKVEGETIAYVFETKRGPLCVYWNPVLRTTGLLPLNRENIRVMDVLGGDIEIKVSKRGSVIPVDSDTRYILGIGITSKMLAEAMSRLEIKGLSPIKIEDIRLGEKQEKMFISGGIKNLSHKKEVVRFSMKKKPNWLYIEIPDKLFLNPLGHEKFLWPIRLSSSVGSGGIVEVILDTHRGSIPIDIPLHILGSKKSEEEVIIDGKGREGVWRKARVYDLDKWVKVRSCWNNKGLYFYVEVEDDEVENFHERDVEPYEGDCVELFFDWDRGRDFNERVFNYDDVQLICTIKSLKWSKDEVYSGPERFTGNKKFPVKLVSISSERTKKGYSMEVGIPWKCIESLGIKVKKVIGFSISVMDVDKNFIKKRRVIWSGTEKNYKDTSKFGLLILEN